jgi:hypothetical protein
MPKNSGAKVDNVLLRNKKNVKCEVFAVFFLRVCVQYYIYACRAVYA